MKWAGKNRILTMAGSLAKGNKYFWFGACSATQNGLTVLLFKFIKEIVTSGYEKKKKWENKTKANWNETLDDAKRVRQTIFCTQSHMTNHAF